MCRAIHHLPGPQELRSPEGRFLILSVDQGRGKSDFSGVFRTLVLEDVSSGESRKLYDYIGRVVVAWSGNNCIIVTDYASKRTSRARVFATDPSVAPVALNKVQLARLLPEMLSEHLLKNDHVYVEVVRVEGSLLMVRVWGYGALDLNGFRWNCQYELNQTTADCKEIGGGSQP
jgi:hypothetical protein